MLQKAEYNRYRGQPFTDTAIITPMPGNLAGKKYIWLTVDLLLFVCGFAIFFSHARFPTDWDACQFVLGMERFSPLDHQPHPPGYFLFIQLAQFLRPIFGHNPGAGHLALLTISAIGGGLLIPAVRRLTLKIFPDRNDLATGAALLALGAPLRLFFGSQALTYTWEGLFATVLISLAIDVKSGKTEKNDISWFAWVLVYAVAVGFRSNISVLFLPLAIYLAISRKWWEIPLGVLLFSAVTLAWLIPTVKACGGFGLYTESLRGHTSYFIGAGFSPDRFLDNLAAVVQTPKGITGLGITGSLIIFILAMFQVTTRKDAVFPGPSTVKKVLIFTLIPLLLFHVLIFYTIRYSLLYIPIFIPVMVRMFDLAILPIVKFLERKKVRKFSAGWIIPAMLGILSYAGFLTVSAPYTLHNIRSLERETISVASTVQGLGNPDSVNIITGRQFRRWGTYMDEYTVWHPMKALYPPELHPHLASMSNGDTSLGRFFIEEDKITFVDSGSNILSPAGNSGTHHIVLDQDAFNILIYNSDGWESRSVTSRENLYWKSFDTEILLLDLPEGLALVPVVDEAMSIEPQQ